MLADQARDELAQIFGEEGLCQRRFDREAAGDLVSCAARAEHDDRHLFLPPSSAELSKKHLAVLYWQHQVDDHEIGKLHLALGERRLNVAGNDDLVALLLEQNPKHVTQGRVVIEDEDRFLRGHSIIVTG